jgi:hypothetical protein
MRKTRAIPPPFAPSEREAYLQGDVHANSYDTIRYGMKVASMRFLRGEIFMVAGQNIREHDER